MAKCVMIQGTMSSAGKSLVTAALCRIFHQDGYSVAPFKSQNMALNSFVTSDGLEMGRAQVMQAEAACIEPSVNMNPILLKPNSDTGSQVIVNGEVLGSMSAKDYFSYKKQLWPCIMKAYEALGNENDIIVIEGAGSPAEINLKKDDIVNMGLALKVNAPVLLVGDIDRGGVFAQLVGTMVLLEEYEKTLVKGLVINKFRGDKSILAPGIQMLEQKTNIPVAGTIPYMKLSLDDEDSLTQRLEISKSKVNLNNKVDIAVIRLPHISNFSDFTVFESYPDVNLRYVDNALDLENPDLLIIPGTKNTYFDLNWIRNTGLEQEIVRVSKDSVVFGICGGYQILGNRLEEGNECMKGLGLLNVHTKFLERKIRTRVRGKLLSVKGMLSCISNMDIEGYEIHMGITMPDTTTDVAVPMLEITDFVTGKENTDGYFMNDVYGTYIHGFFDSEPVCTAIVRTLAQRKGIKMAPGRIKTLREIKEEQYDLLAGIVRENMNIPYIYEIMGIK